MGDALKACDWCRGEAKLWTGNPAGMAGSMTWDVAVQCVSCGARGPVFRDGAYSEDGQRDKAIAAWNRRAPSPLPSVEAVAKALDRLLTRYVTLADSGDCGFWNPEEEEQVIEARRVLALIGGEKP